MLRRHGHSCSTARDQGWHGRRHDVVGMRSQGRFSGRLSSKEDEERLVEECGRLGPLLGGLPGCDGACDTLSRIVRSIACSDLRRHLEGKERRFRVRLPLYPVTVSMMSNLQSLCVFVTSAASSPSTKLSFNCAVVPCMCT